MKTVTLKLPEQLGAWVEAEANRTGISKSEVIRQILQERQQRRGETAYGMAADLCGCVGSGRRDLSTNKKYLKGFGK